MWGVGNFLPVEEGRGRADFQVASITPEEAFLTHASCEAVPSILIKKKQLCIVSSSDKTRGPSLLL